MEIESLLLIMIILLNPITVLGVYAIVSMIYQVEIQKCIDSGYTMYLNGEEISPLIIDWKNRKYNVEIDNDNSIILVTY